MMFLGVMTERQAADEGYTHHGRLYGLLPCYARVFEFGMDIAFKWAPLEIFEPLLTPMWCGIWEWMHDEPPQFGVVITREIRR